MKNFRPRGNMATTEERIKQKAFTVGVSINKLPDYCGGVIGKTALADALASGRLAQPIADKIEEALDVMQSMKIDAGSVFSPGFELPIDFSQPASLRAVFEQRLRDYRDKKDPMISRYCVVRIGLNYFDRVNSNEVLSRPDPSSCACFESPALANEVVRELLKIGRKADVQIVPLMRRRSETAKTLSQVGFVTTEVEHDAD
jgi:hypothetical protein